MKALLKNYHQSPRKTRLIADMIRGKSVESAKAALSFATQKSSFAIEKLLNSAVASARDAGISSDQLFVKTITIDKGMVMKRMRPFGRGRAGRLNKTSSIIKIELGSLPTTKTAKKSSKTSNQQPATSNQL